MVVTLLTVCELPPPVSVVSWLKERTVFVCTLAEAIWSDLLGELLVLTPETEELDVLVDVDVLLDEAELCPCEPEPLEE